MLINKNDKILIKRALKYIKPHKKTFILDFISILLGIVLDLIQPYIWAVLLTNLFKQDFKSVLVDIITITILSVASSLFGFIQSYLSSFLSERIIFDLKKDIFDKILNLPVKAFDEMRTGDFISRLQGDAGGVADIITNQLLKTIVEVLRVIVIGIVIFSMNIYLSLIVLACFPITYLIYIKFGKKIRSENESLFKFNDSYFSHIHQTISGIREVISLGAKRTSLKLFLDLSTELKNRSLKMSILNNIAQFFSEIVNFISQILVMLVGVYFVYINILSMKNFIAFNSYSGQFSNSLMSITSINTSIQQVLTSLERIFGLIDNLSYELEVNGDTKLEKINGNIVFKNVSFHYNEDGQILKNISLNIPANKKIAIVGPSGSGKSTLFNLILRFYKPTSGSITIDGIDLSKIDEESLRNNIAIVHQEPYFMTVSIKENLKFACPNATDEAIVKACTAACIHDYIDDLPDKYDTVLGENGITLSGGQKQRLAIARVLLRKTKIILFDEATSSLDNESQIKITAAINEISKEHTVLIIAHRLVTVLEAGEIIVIVDGEIAGTGTHSELIKNNHIYKKLYESEIDTIKSNSENIKDV